MHIQEIPKAQPFPCTLHNPMLQSSTSQSLENQRAFIFFLFNFNEHISIALQKSVPEVGKKNPACNTIFSHFPDPHRHLFHSAVIIKCIPQFSKTNRQVTVPVTIPVLQHLLAVPPPFLPPASKPRNLSQQVVLKRRLHQLEEKVLSVRYRVASLPNS